MAGSSQDHANAITNVLNVVVGLPLLLVEEVAETAYEIVNGVVNLAAIPLDAIVPGYNRPLLRNRGMTPFAYNRLYRNTRYTNRVLTALGYDGSTITESSSPGSTWARMTQITQRRYLQMRMNFNSSTSSDYSSSRSRSWHTGDRTATRSSSSATF